MSEATFRRTSDLADGFGAGEVRAEELIAASKQSVSPELRAAQLLDRNEEATAELDWDKAAKACGVKPDAVLDAAVRGDYVVLVVEGEDGRTGKVVCEVSAVGGKSAPAKAEQSKAKPKSKSSGKSKG